MNTLERRAYDAWTQGRGKAGQIDNRDQPSDATEVTRHGVTYVELTNRNGVIATYRLRPDGVLSLTTGEVP